jgi:hypothetical protein
LGAASAALVLTGGGMDDIFKTRPKSVAIIALGPSARDFVAQMCSKKGFLGIDEVWGVNTANRVYKLDKCFIMDDLRVLEKRYPDWANELRNEKTPIVTCKAYDDYPTSVAYPLKAVIDACEDDYFSTSVAYQIGLAIMMGVRELYVYGADYYYPNAIAVESGLGCVGYLLGLAKGKGVEFKVPNSSTLLDAHLAYQDENGDVRRKLYGYDYNPGDAFTKVQAGSQDQWQHKFAQKAYMENMKLQIDKAQKEKKEQKKAEKQDQGSQLKVVEQ